MKGLGGARKTKIWKTNCKQKSVLHSYYDDENSSKTDLGVVMLQGVFPVRITHLLR